MKKLLSLLSVLTISGTAVSSVIADYPYQKNNIKNLSELNWTGLNITKNKRNTQNNQTKHIFKTNGADIPSKQQIKEKVKELNPQLSIDKISVTDITENSAKISIIGFSGKKPINFIVDKSVPIDKVITNPNLGEIDFSRYNNISVKEQVKFRLKELKPQLDTTKINVINISTYTAKVISNDTSIYTGEIDINYSRPVKSVFKNTKLGLIRINGVNKPTEQEIKNKIKELNKDLENNINDFEVSDITTTNAKINFKRKDILSGEVVVTFISNINLNKIIKNNNLGEFKTENLSNPTKEQIKNKIKEMYTDLDITKIKVENITNSSAKITSADENVYTNNVNVNYTVSIDSLNW